MKKSKMEEYLKSLPSIVAQLKENTHQDIVIVLGNESCDLDSAVSALVYAHFLAQADMLAVPLLNVPREDVPLKTEVSYCIGSKNLTKIPCRDELDLSALTGLKLVLVDHHVLPKKDNASLLPKVERIIDHRQLSEGVSFASSIDIDIHFVGSCATLVAKRILSNGYRDITGLLLLRSAIITDTVNMSPTAQKATDQDKMVLDEIESIVQTVSHIMEPRVTLHEAINQAKQSIEGFTVDQLMRKDLKVVAFSNGVLMAVPSIVILTKDLCKREDPIEVTFEAFCRKYESAMLIIMGNQNGRDVLIYYTKEGNQAHLAHSVADVLLQHPDIGMTKTNALSFVPRSIYLHQANVAFSRKKLLPVIQSVQIKNMYADLITEKKIV
jgi:exopolyphosphatase